MPGIAGRALLIVLGLTAGGSLAFYTFTTYMQKYLVNTARMNAQTASVVMAGALVVRRRKVSQDFQPL